MSSGQVPASLHEKFTLLRYFAQYMDENLTEGGESGQRAGAKLGPQRSGGNSSNPNLAIPQIKRWIRAPKAIIMHLTNGTIQVSCIVLRVIIILLHLLLVVASMLLMLWIIWFEIYL